MVRILELEIQNFKNINYGKVDFRNKSSVNQHARIQEPDIVGIYGQNGSGKTALIESLDVLSYLMKGEEIPYDEYGGLIDDSTPTNLTITFFIKNNDYTYRVKYTVELKRYTEKKCIIPNIESLSYQLPGYRWKKAKSIQYNGTTDSIVSFSNDNLVIFDNFNFGVITDIKTTIEKLGLYAAGEGTSVFFCNFSIQTFTELLKDTDGDLKDMYNIIDAISFFAHCDLHVIKVSQLGYINALNTIPINAKYTIPKGSIVAKIPYKHDNFLIPEYVYNFLKRTIESINIAIRGIIPELSLALEEETKSLDKDGKTIYSIKIFSIRGNKKFSIQYESEGIKRIVSVLSLLISVYNRKETTLIIDELDSGIYEFLLGELIGVMERFAEGQLIFTSHNLRVLERLPSSGILCSTTNPNNRFIQLQGVSGNNNKRDFYIRAITLGGQKEELYSIDELEDIGYSFRKAKIH